MSSRGDRPRNPMIQKELRQRMRDRRGWILPSLYLVALSAVVALVYFEMSSNRNQQSQGWEIGLGLFFTLSYSQLVLLLLLAPIFSAGSITLEKEQRTLPALLTSLLSSAQIWRGKFAASLLFVLLLLVAGLPILSAAFVFGGIGLWELFIGSLTTIIILAAISAISLYWSSAFRRSVISTAVSYVTVVVLTVVTFIVFLLSESSLHQGASSWQAIPGLIRLPLYFNPIFFLTVSFVPVKHLYPEWLSCLAIYIALAGLSTFFALRNLRRAGDSS
jgi:ABC-type transport system involved in multi-copper enzyme maturation permease subunit